jgi:hypothetical protein
VLGNAPPYALDTFGFLLPALASCAGRAPVGGDRDLALGVWMSARLAHAMLPPISLPAVERTIRADRAKQWLGSLTIPQPARLALFRAIDATATYPPQAADALAELATIVTGHIDPPSQQEIANLVARLRALAGVGQEVRGTPEGEPPTSVRLPDIY